MFYAVVNDLVGGWAVSEHNKPLSQHNTPAGEHDIADFMSKTWAVRIADLLNASEQLREAIENAGPEPRFHRSMMHRHKKEWPTLWKAIRKIVNTTYV